MNLHHIITSDPDILHGTPVFAGTRVPVKNLFDYLEASDSVDDFLVDFDYIPKESVASVLASSKSIFSDPSLYESIAG